jgi:beta-galactosidase
VGGALREVAGSVVRARAAVLHDSDCWWALDGQGLPSEELDYHGELRRAHRALWDAGLTADFAHPEDPEPDRYRLLVAPALFLLSDAAAERLRAYVAGGGTLLVQHSAGVVDERHQARLGGYPAEPLRRALGVRVEEYRPLAASGSVRLSDGSAGTVWSELLAADGAEAVASYTSGALAGRPAVTRHTYGEGTAWYVSTRLDGPSYADLLARVLAAASLTPEAEVPRGVEAVRRWSPTGDTSWLFLLNHTAAEVTLPAAGHDLLTGRTTPAASVTLAPGGAAVLRQQA